MKRLPAEEILGVSRGPEKCGEERAGSQVGGVGRRRGREAGRLWGRDAAAVRADSSERGAGGARWRRAAGGGGAWPAPLG